MTAANSSAIQGNWRRVGDHHPKKPTVFRLLVQLQNHAPDDTQHVLDVAVGFDAGRKRVFELSRHPAEHLPEDVLLRCELVVERPPRYAGGLSQVVHADEAEAPFHEQPPGRLYDGLPRPACAGLSGWPRLNHC